MNILLASYFIFKTTKVSLFFINNGKLFHTSYASYLWEVQSWLVTKITGNDLTI